MITCPHCGRKFASKSSLCNHRHRCPEMKTGRGRGRPTNEELERRKTLSSSSPQGKRSLSPETVAINEPVKKKLVSQKVPILWADSYEKALLMSKEGADEKVIKLALSWDKCFQDNPPNLKESLEDYYDLISKDLQSVKSVIDEDYKERVEDDKVYLRPLLDADSSKTVEELYEDKAKLENKLLYVNYAINLRGIAPQLKMLKLMMSLVPEIKKPDVLLRSVSQPVDTIGEKIVEAGGGVDVFDDVSYDVSYDIEDDEDDEKVA